MASHLAIASVSNTILRVLQRASAGSEFAHVEFRLPQIDDFGIGRDAVSIYLYRTSTSENKNAIRHPAPGRTGIPLLLTLHYLLIPRLTNARDEQRLLAWTMRVLADTPVLSSQELNQTVPDVFKPEEAVQLIAEDLSLSELTSLWQALQHPYHPAIPYLARIINIES